MKLVAGINGVSTIATVNVTAAHNSSTSLAVIETPTLVVDIGDAISVSLGYDGGVYGQVFTGYVKTLDYNNLANTYVITANDKLIQAIDYFIVPTNPSTPLTYKNISGEELVRQLLELAGLTSYTHDDTYFTFGVSNEFEVLQVSVYDFCQTICDLLTWHMWCDENGTIHFENRKPFVMSGSEPQPGWSNDTPISYTLTDSVLIDGSKHTDEKNLRNRVVVWGANDLYAEARDESSPYFHWKTAALGAQDMLDTQAACNDTANYNLHLFNRITQSVNATVIGDYHLLPHRTITINSTKLGISNEQYYINSAEHRLGPDGYLTTMELTK